MTENPFAPGTPHTIPPERRPCACGSRAVHWKMSNGQRIARCDQCGNPNVYCVPNHEVGEGPKPLRRIAPDTVDASQKIRILLRDRGRCALCRTSEEPLHIGHLVSLAEGKRYTDKVHSALRSDANLVVMCDACNLDLGKQSVPLLWIVALHLDWKRNTT